MRNPEATQLKESSTQSQFRIELPNPEALLAAIAHNGQMDNDGFQPTLEIGSLHSESGLFSQINVQTNTIQDGYMLPGGYSISVDLVYKNPADQYWSKEQTEQLLKLLHNDYPDADIGNKTNSSNHSLVIMGLSKIAYEVDLGYENQITAYENQVERDSKAISDKEALILFMRAPYPIPVDSRISVRPMDIDSNIHPEDFFTIPITYRHISKNQAVKGFTETTKQWMWKVQDIVNAMAKVKGIPQSGKLTLLPPSEIPQT